MCNDEGVAAKYQHNEQPEYAIYNGSSVYGPLFGNCDILIVNKSDILKGSSTAALQSFYSSNRRNFVWAIQRLHN
eukprot:TRINITY_DN14560_c0_g1_i1.p1 TRINITY_DN14560_c0_g1~~TRINITY_DN14560_c0_g1_i1.p1  ORF type:complete len:75 (-),score=11.87 TRINITY_DN14560_c0_g1_i1:227-451(-)